MFTSSPLTLTPTTPHPPSFPPFLSAERCAAQTAPSNVCLSYYEHQCAGICTSETRLVPIYKSCLDDPLSKNPADLGKGITDWDEGMEFLEEDEEEDDGGD